MDKNKLIQNAQKLIQKGQLDKAIREYQKIVEADPKDVRTRLKIGDLYAKRGAVREAADTYLQVAEAYGQQGFFLKAVAVYKQILKLDPNLVDVNLRLADLYHQLGLMSDAMAQYQSVANFYEKSGNTRASFETLQKMLDLDPDNVASRIKLAEMFSKENMVDQAVDQFRQAADYLKDRNRIDDYIKVVERLIYHDPNEVELTRELANIYLAKGDTKRALAKLQVCFKSNPHDVETLHLLARAFLDLGQPSKTVSVYKELAKIYGDDGDVDQQRDTWKKVLEIAPDDPDAQAALGGRREAAAEPVPAPAPARSAAPAAGRPPGARAAAPTPAAAPAEGGAEAIAKLLTETDVYVKYGLHDKAIEHLKKVFALDPQNLQGHEKAKDLFKQAGNNDAAGQELVTLVQLTKDRDAERAKAYLGELLSVSPGLPEVDGFVAELGRPEAEQVSFLETPVEIPSEDEVVIADGDDEVLVADGFDDDGFGVEVEGTDPELDGGMADVVIDDDVDAEVTVAGDDGFVIDEPETGSDGGAFVIDDDLLDGDLDSAVAAAEAFADEADSPTQTLAIDEVPDLVPTIELDDEAKTFVGEIPVQPEDEAELVEVDGAEIDIESAEMPLVADDATATGEKSPEEIADELEEAEFFIQQGLPDEAHEVLNGILAVIPDHPEAKRLLAQLNAGEGAEIADEDAPEAGFDDFDLAEELANLEAEDTAMSSPLDAYQVSADDVFAEFKKGVAKQVSNEDAETHYDLGIAYREMGLVKDAIDEFKLAANQPKRRVESLSLVAICLKETGETEEAIEVLKEALGDDNLDKDVAKVLYFDIGDGYQSLEDEAEARYYYRKVFKLDPKFRDVKARLEALGDDGSGDDDDEPPSASGRNGVQGHGTKDGKGGAKRAGKAGKVGYV